MKRDNVIESKSFAFAVNIVKLCRYHSCHSNDHVLFKQLLKSGTSIGANVSEAVVAPSRVDFSAKLCIALKEANETKFWLKLLIETELITQSEFNELYSEVKEIIALLVSITKKVRADFKGYL